LAAAADEAGFGGSVYQSHCSGGTSP
jgi:hypothetical protein